MIPILKKIRIANFRLMALCWTLLIVNCSSTIKQNDKIDNTEIVTNKEAIQTGLSFINSYVQNCNKMRSAQGAVEWVSNQNQVTISFKTKLKTMVEEAYKLEPVMGLDADPLFDAQDYPDKGFELESYNPQTGVLVVKGIDWPEFKVTMKLVKQKGKWLVDACGSVKPGNE